MRNDINIINVTAITQQVSYELANLEVSSAVRSPKLNYNFLVGVAKGDLEIGRSPEFGHSLEFLSLFVRLNPINSKPPATGITPSPFVGPSLTARGVLSA